MKAEQGFWPGRKREPITRKHLGEWISHQISRGLWLTLFLLLWELFPAVCTPSCVLGSWALQDLAFHAHSSQKPPSVTEPPLYAHLRALIAACTSQQFPHQNHSVVNESLNVYPPNENGRSSGNQNTVSLPSVSPMSSTVLARSRCLKLLSPWMLFQIQGRVDWSSKIKVLFPRLKKYTGSPSRMVVRKFTNKLILNLRRIFSKYAKR